MSLAGLALPGSATFGTGWVYKRSAEDVTRMGGDLSLRTPNLQEIRITGYSQSTTVWPVESLEAGLRSLAVFVRNSLEGG